jgi:hypothetical protein
MEAFDKNDLTDLAYDYFRPTYERLAAAEDLRGMVQGLLEYVERSGQIDELLDRVARARPREYRNYASKFRR